MRPRIIPCLLLQEESLVKTVKFGNPVYVGDPINAVKIFNEKEVDELIILDITESRSHQKPVFNLISEIAEECFMPLCYGGGIGSLEDMERLFRIGIEKISINSGAVRKPDFITEAVRLFGGQSIVVSIDVKKDPLGKYEVFINGGRTGTGLHPIDFAKRMEEKGAGEILLNSIDRDGTMQGYDIELIKNVSEAVHIPVIACGGAGRLSDFQSVIREGGASAAAAGSFFVFFGKHKAVLMTYPEPQDLEEALCW